MSHNNSSAGESCEGNDRKRKSDITCVDDDNKKTKLSTSLGLSLLQAYDEEELSSDEENIPKTVEEEISVTTTELVEETSDATGIVQENSDTTELAQEISDVTELVEETSAELVQETSDATELVEETSDATELTEETSDVSEFVEETSDATELVEETLDMIDFVSIGDTSCQTSVDNLSSLMVEEEEEICMKSSDSEKIVEKEHVDESTVVEYDVQDSLDLRNDEITPGELDEQNLKESQEKSKDELEEPINEPAPDSTFSLESNKICSKETIAEENEKKKPVEIVKDYNFSIFGKDENSSDVTVPDSKPTKKVKLNRSKFVKPADESSNKTKITSTKSVTSVPDPTTNISSIKFAETKLPEPDNQIDDSSTVTEESRVADVMETKIEAVQETMNVSEEPIEETNYHHSLEKESLSDEDVSLVIEADDDDDDKASTANKLDDGVHLAVALDESIDDESTNMTRENSPTFDVVSETVCHLQTKNTVENIVDDEPLPEDIGTVAESNFSHPEFDHNAAESAREILDESEIEEEISEVAKSQTASPEYENEEVEIPISDQRDEEANMSDSDEENNETAVALNDTAEQLFIHSSVETMDEPEENNVKLNDRTTVEEDIETETKKPDSSEVAEKLVEQANKLDNITSDEDVFEDAVETIEVLQNQLVQESAESITPPKHVEISKLEQALTGRLENFQSHLKMANKKTFGKKSSPETEVKPAVEDAKQNIKLHLSVQGDRVSIKNTQSISETTPLQPIRVKRQYHKRPKVPGELEAKQASAKEYSHRLRQRTERETPGAKKRPKNKKKSEEESKDTAPDLSSNNSSSSDVPEKVVSPITVVAINKLPSRKRNVANKVQPIKLKISKNANVTIECTSKYDVCEPDEGNSNSVDVNEKIVGILEEARKNEGSSSSSVESTPNPWSEPDIQRMERLLKESNITITPVSSERDVSSPPTSLPKPNFNAQETLKSQNTTLIESETTTPESVIPMSESGENTSKNLTISLKVDTEELHTPWKIVKSPRDELNSGTISNNSSSFRAVDVKSEIRKKIAFVEKRKQDPNASGSGSEPQQKAEISLSDEQLSFVESSQLEDISSDNLEEMDIESFAEQSVPNALSSPLPPVHKSPVHKSPSSGTGTPAKLTRLPADLFPKKRGRPTKAMVAAREAYRQEQENIEKLKRGEEPTSLLSDVSISTPTAAEPVKIVKRARKIKHERPEKKDSDDLSTEEVLYDPNREAEQQKRIEEERMRKEEERERKNEMRRLKAKERSDFIKAKRLRQKMKAKERHKLAKELRRLQQEEKKKLEEQLKRLPASMGFDDDTRMSAENSQAANISFSTGLGDDDSSGATNDLSQKLKKSRMEVTDSDSKDLMVDQIAEYQWPIQGGDLYMIQEQVSNFLGVKSFKRKYPDIWRRPVDSEERAYLVDSGLVSETLCDLGITAVRSAEVLDIMCSDFSEKYEEFRRYMREKQMKELSFKQRAWANGLGYKLLMADGSKQDMKKRAMEAVSNWNSALNKSRVDDRRSHMDLQTFIIHYPKQRGSKMTVPSPKVGSYPVAILPGQFCDYYNEYTPTELRYLPVNTVLYGPLKHPTIAQSGDASQTDSDDSSSSDDSSTTSEDTQATEETLEDLDSSAVLDGNETKFGAGDKDTSFVGDEELMPKEINGVNGDRDPLGDIDSIPKVEVLCKVCLGDQFRNKMNVPEVMISCSQCSSTNHPTCLDLSPNIVPRIKSYAWQCPDCKICAQCKENADEDKMLFCDTCDQGYHIYCVGLIKVPAGNWQCKECSRLREKNESAVDFPIKEEPALHIVDTIA